MHQTKSPILIVDDDREDLELIEAAVKGLKIDRPIKYFRSGDQLITYLKQSEEAPFLIISDVNLPDKDGFEIRRIIAEDDVTKYKSVPFIFWSTAASEKQIQRAYDLPAQGFFFKSSKFSDLCSTLDTIIDYWKKSEHPKRVV